jgi:hypothetical protein
MDAIMKTKLKLLMYLMLTTLPSLMIITSPPTKSAKKNIEYLPIAQYQKMLSDIISNFMATLLYKKAHAEDKANQNEEKITIITKEDIPKLSRDETLEAMKIITTKLFDPTDLDSLSMHLLALKALCQHLDPETDKKTIDGIHFLLANQHRSSSFDTIFWMQAINKYELTTVIPTTQEIANKKGPEKLAVLRKKMTLQTQKIKEEQLKMGQSVDQPILVA